jgi:heme-degrading monooxygenase HmoA
MYAIVWEFSIPAERVAEFERVYGPEGEWAALFRHGEGYLGTELLRDEREDEREPGRYLTLDRWSSRLAYDAFRAHFVDEYQALDRRCEAREALIGAFTMVGV